MSRVASQRNQAAKSASSTQFIDQVAEAMSPTRRKGWERSSGWPSSACVFQKVLMRMSSAADALLVVVGDALKPGDVPDANAR